MTAHQRIIRDSQEPRDGPTSLHGYSVETISKGDAIPLILRYEWLGNVGQATMFVGLLSPDRELHGVACFGHGPGGDITDIIGPSICLTRGACVHYAPKNAASFLIMRACKLISRITGTSVFFAYCDPVAGEYGGVYQACGWAYIGQGLNGKKGREKRFFVLAPGLDRDVPSNWQTTRCLRPGKKEDGRWMGWAEARSKDYEISIRPAKHVYAVNVGRDRLSWRENLICPPYPAPQPELKRKPREVSDEPSMARQVVKKFYVASPVPAQDDLFQRSEADGNGINGHGKDHGGDGASR